MTDKTHGSVTDSGRQIDCPRCHGQTMETVKVLDTTIDRCSQCDGTWYDDGELKSILGPRYNYDGLMQNMEIKSSDLVCPICQEKMTGCVFKSRRFTVKLDHCLACKGYWLDRGELDQIQVMEQSFQKTKPSRFRPRPVAPAPKTTAVAEGSVLAHYQSFDQESMAEYQSMGIPLYFFCLSSQLPVEVFNPTKFFPFHLIVLILINAGIFLIQSSMPDTDMVTFIKTFSISPSRVFSSTGWYTLITHGFLHANVIHLAGNMYILWIFGDNVCDVFQDHGKGKGTWLFLLYYGILLLFSGLLACIFTAPNMYLLGASGAISGIIASYWRLFPRARLYQIFLLIPFKIPMWLYLFFWFAFNFLVAYSGGTSSSISWQGHLSGFFLGFVLLPYFLPFKLQDIRKRQYLLG